LIVAAGPRIELEVSMLIILLLLVLFIMLFSGLALFVAKVFILGLILLPLIAIVAFILFWRRAVHPT
jgi:hypothetical protein